MINLKSIKLEPIELAHIQLMRENKISTGYNLCLYAHKITKWTDKHPKPTSMILSGGVFKSKIAEKHFKEKYHIGDVEGRIFHLPKSKRRRNET